MSLAGSLDTNVLARLLVQDDVLQADLAARLLERHARKSETLLVPVTVVLELEWVLRSRYKFSKAEVIKTFSGLLASIELVFESEGALEQALVSYEEGAADFGEYLHLALAQVEQALPFWTFDAKASKALGAKLMKSQ
ncbi:MAG: type II toxin-antitoxin system VapC family toxin [Rhodoferax sp.]|nr:type II toxin-antitoxin system VapC family toxin [Rhodoferax sp.]